MSYPTLPTDEPDAADARERFVLASADLDVLDRGRNDPQRLGLAVLLKVYQALGYAPSKGMVPRWIVQKIADQLGISPTQFRRYSWTGRTWRRHVGWIRETVGLHPLGASDFATLRRDLIDVAGDRPSRADLLAAAVSWCQEHALELPPESALRRLAQSVRREFLERLYQRVAQRIEPALAERLDRSLHERQAHEDGPSATTVYDWMQELPGKLGMDTLLAEVEKLRWVREAGIRREVHFAGISDRALVVLRDRARGEEAAGMRRHPRPVRLTLLAALVLARQSEVTDHIVRILLELIRRVEKRAERSIERRFLPKLEKVMGKTKILYQIASAATTNPEGTVRDVVYPIAPESVEEEGLDFEVVRIQEVASKYRAHYRRMVRPVLDMLVLRADNPAHAPLLEGIELVRRYIDSKAIHYPTEERIPERLLTGRWRQLVLKVCPEGTRAVRHAFEMCVLERLARALKCKEVWVEGAYRYRNPADDLPQNWDAIRVECYRRRGFLLNPAPLLDAIRGEMGAGLDAFHRFLGRAPSEHSVEVRRPGGGDDAVFHVPPLARRAERPILQELKTRVLERFGIHDLIDLLVEADREVALHRFFETSGTRQVLSEEELRRRLLIVLFGLGTNLGLKRVHAAAGPSCSYDDLRYFRDRYVTAPAVRRAIAALVNRILERRNPAIWGKGTACASDSKHLGAWDQNLIAEWHPRYRGRGVMVYWHVETNATCIYSNLKSCSSSEVASMIEGLVRHDTEMRVERNFVDSHGQSEVAFAFARFLGFELMPRLKRIKHERLYLPMKDLRGTLPRLHGVLTRPIRWELIAEQYDEMVRHVVAVQDGIAPVDSILRRFNSYNRSHPTYRAFSELGKALKTSFLCRYLAEAGLRQEVHEGLNVVENWNSIVDFLFFGRKTEFQTNDPEQQELGILCLHLLQNALILVNTVFLERVIVEEQFQEKMEAEDRRALTPLFTTNVNPYGDFTLDLGRPSILADLS